MHLVISYDIADDTRRARLHKLLKDYGTRVQFSVFECRISRVHWVLLRHRIQHLINADEDSVRCYRVCKTCQPKAERIGGEKPLEGPTVIVK